MVISGAFIVPHGALILNAKSSHTDGRYELHKHMEKIAHKITKIQPDIIFITSPHGISLSDDFGIYVNKSARGNAEWEGEYQEFKVNINIDLEFSQNLLKFLKINHFPVSSITAFSQNVPIPLRWGEAVPLWFLRDLEKTNYCIMSQPQKRYNPSTEFLDRVISIGITLGNFFNTHQKKILVIISADLAHTHQKEGPYGFYPFAEQTDELFEVWMNAIGMAISPSELQEHVKKALCCGNIGFFLLHGILTNSNLTCGTITRHTPTYYGMMVAEFLPDT